MSDPTKPNEGDNSALYVGLVVGVLVIYAGCIIIRCSLVKRTMTRERVRLAERRAALRAVRRELQVRNAEGLERQDILWHARVLAILFPEKVTVTETVTTMDDALTTTSAVAVDAHHLMYDPETQRYHWTDEFLADPTIQTCSICMEPFEQIDDVVTGRCVHSYHYDCMMSWLGTKLYKNDCPYCRQELWTASVYDEILCQLKEADKDVHVATPAHCNEQETLGRQ